MLLFDARLENWLVKNWS